MKKILLLGALLFSFASAGFDFGECSGAGTFEQEIAYYKSDYENAVTVGEIPAGIQGLHLELISNRDVDIRLYGAHDDRIVHWPYGILNHSYLETGQYKGVSISYSGYNGVEGRKGHEFIVVKGTTPTAFTMKAFGFRAGYATVNYSWTGKDGCTPSKFGTGTFAQEILEKATTLVGTIPPNVENVEINLTSDKDLDIQLYAQDGTAIARWKPAGLMSGLGKQSVVYKDMNITWSGYYGVNNQKGHEYIRIEGNTTEMLTMKVYGYESGEADVVYKWGFHDNIKPVIILKGDALIRLHPGDLYIDKGATAYDNIDGNISEKIVVKNLLDVAKIGTYVIRYNVEDAAGNKATEVRRVVKVVEPDIVPPVLTILGDMFVNINAGEKYIDSGAVAFDNIDGDITDSIIVENNVNTDINVSETQMVIYKVTDREGNKANSFRMVYVHVPDTTKPEIILHGSETQTVVRGHFYLDAGATTKKQYEGDLDNRLIVDNPVDINKIGTYIVRYNVEDLYGNKADEVTRVVHVVQAPIAVAREQPLLLIRIEFSDYSFHSTATVWHNKIYGYEQESLNDYYDEISYGRFKFVEANETDGIDDGIVTVNLNKEHPNPSNWTVLFLEDAKEALKMANKYIDFSLYDRNKNGAISKDELQIMFLLAGGESSLGMSPGVWGHSWCLHGDNAIAPIHDGVKLMSCQDNGSYTMFGERHNTHDATIGIIAHELGHGIFDLPDLYDTDGSSEGIGNFGLMGTGSWTSTNANPNPGSTPVHMTGWSKIKAGFVVPETVPINMNALHLIETSSLDYVLYRLNTKSEGEYFLIENRGASGYDMGLSSLVGSSDFMGGLSILHIDENQNNNNDETHKLVDVEEANRPGLDTQLNRGHVDNLYKDNVDGFSDSSYPNSKDYNGQTTGIVVENISQSGSVMTADIKIN